MPVFARRISLGVLATALTALVATSCSGLTGIPRTSPGASAGQSGGAPGSLLPPLSVTVTDVKYGLLAIRTMPGAQCDALLQISGGYYGDIPPGTLPQQ